MIITDIVIVGLLILAGYMGTRRGVVLIALELASFVMATVIAALVYQPLGAGLRSWGGLATPLANVSGFAVAWMAAEVLSALLLRMTVWRLMAHRLQPSWLSQVGGAALNALKALILIAASLILFAGLPFSAATKQPVTDALAAKLILNATASWQQQIQSGLGHDLNESLTVFTVSPSAESQERIALGFTTTSGTVDEADEAAMLQLVNHERTQRGLVAVKLNAKARAVARTYAARMLADGYFSHIDADGHSPFDRMRAGGVSFDLAGENLALAPTLQLAHQGLMNSPGHRANILDTNYRTVGIGIVDAGPYGLMVVQDFTD
ncbi:MAG TPA: CvpA family protein [Candidatus Saccharimonadia bacterium]|nr:CvpA family protein [Candidatus Saccharimonadia bacterium]